MSNLPSTTSSSSKILSRSILFRHGARGPGESELSAWEKVHPVVTQWKEEEIENLSSIGESQMTSLGSWFCQKCNDLEQKSTEIAFSTSKSSRASESGQLFINGYSQTKLSSSGITTHIHSTIYNIDADYYFRPWKVYTEVEKGSKANMTTSVAWKTQVKSNHDLLVAVQRDLGLKSSLLETPERILWSLTYIVNVLVCEEFWPKSEIPMNQRKYLHQLMTRLHESKLQIRSLACWVWSTRFVSSGFQVDLGGWLFLDMIQKLFGYKNNQSVQLFAGHDYTIISVLAAAGLLTALVSPVEWGAYVIMELNEITTTTSSSVLEEPNQQKQNLELKIYHNRQPFGSLFDNTTMEGGSSDTDTAGGDDFITVHPEREVLLASLDMPQLGLLLERVCSVLRDHGRGLPPGFLLPSAITQ